MIDFDANATLGLLPEVGERLCPIVGTLYNPSSVHTRGQRTRALIEDAREKVRTFLDLGRKDSVVFTSGATEANNAAIVGTYKLFHDRFPTVHPTFITTSIEHPSVLEPLREITKSNVTSKFVRPFPDGSITADLFDPFLEVRPHFVTCMTANNETGHLLPIREIVSKVRKAAPDALIHSDLVQVFGKVPVSFRDLELDMATVSGHKLGSLSGVGALIVRDGLELPSFIFGGAQEIQRRAGTENVLGIVSFGFACEVAQRRLAERTARLLQFHDLVERLLDEHSREIIVNFPGLPRLLNTWSLRVPGILADDLVVRLDLAGVAVSAGSACASGKPSPSHVLLACGLNEEEARESFRLSIHPDESLESVITGLNQMFSCIAHMKRFGVSKAA